MFHFLFKYVVKCSRGSVV